MVGERIKEARLKLGYSAEQVADFLHASPATIYRYENGDISKLPSKFIKPLADFLCVSPGWLMGWSEENGPAEQEVPVTSEARILARGIDKFPEDERKKALAVVQAMFAQYSEYFEKGDEHGSKPK